MSLSVNVRIEIIYHLPRISAPLAHGNGLLQLQLCIASRGSGWGKKSSQGQWSPAGFFLISATAPIDSPTHPRFYPCHQGVALESIMEHFPAVQVFLKPRDFVFTESVTVMPRLTRRSADIKKHNFFGFLKASILPDRVADILPFSLGTQLGVWVDQKYSDSRIRKTPVKLHIHCI